MRIILSTIGITAMILLVSSLIPNMNLMQMSNAQLAPSSTPSTTTTKSLSPSSTPSTTTTTTSPSTTTSTTTTLTQQCITAQNNYKTAKLALDAAIKAFSAAPWDPVLKSNYINAINAFNSASLTLAFIPNCPKPAV